MQGKENNQSISGRKKTIIIILFLLFPYFASALTIVHISDIHASNKKTKKSENGTIISPKMYKTYLQEVKNIGADVVIATGDYSSKNEKKYYRKISDVMKGADVIWTKGNHDKEKNFRLLSPQSDYFIDREDWRIIVLDTTRQFGSSTGFLNSEQINFLQSAEQTDKNIIIAMHHPPFWYNSRVRLYSSEKEHLFGNFFSALTPNVKYVLTGHWHHDFETEIDGVKFQTVKALSQDNTCNYEIINLDVE